MKILEEPQLIIGPDEIDNSKRRFIIQSLEAKSNKKTLKSFFTDKSVSVSDLKKQGSTSVLIREDILSPLLQIKKNFNSYGVPFVASSLNININNENISLFARAGLEVNLNMFCGMSNLSNYKNDDYFIGPNYNKPIGNFFELNVYGYARKKLNYLYKDEKPFEKEIDIYDIKDTYLLSPPKIKKIFKPLINITKIFENHGFVQEIPDISFFLKSDFEKSNWFRYYYPKNIHIGYKYTDLLSIIYDDVEKSIWAKKKLVWEGKKFNVN